MPNELIVSRQWLVHPWHLVFFTVCSRPSSSSLLIVDEILAVGDADFQAKSKARMLELMGGGTTVLFVSHSIDQIREMCDRAIWLEHGQMKMIGETNAVCDQYAGGD